MPSKRKRSDSESDLTSLTKRRCVEKEKKTALVQWEGDNWLEVGKVLAEQNDLRTLQSLTVALGHSGDVLMPVITSLAKRLFMGVRFCQKCCVNVGNTYTLSNNRLCYLCNDCEQSSKMPQKDLLNMIRYNIELKDTFVWVTRNTLKQYVASNKQIFVDVPQFMRELLDVILCDKTGIRRYSCGKHTKFLLRDVIIKYGKMIA